MEPVTHVLAGACVGRAGLNRTTAYATAVMAISGEMPDIDVVVNFFGPVTGFAHHRGFTHTLLGLPLDAALTVGVVWLFTRWRRKTPPLPARWGLLFLYACLGGVLHILLDFTNNYGVRPFAPFHNAWYSWDIVFILEPLMTLALIAGLVMPSLFGLINQEIGARQRGPRGRGWAIAALVFVALLWGFRDYQHSRAITALESRVYDGAEPLRVSAFPYPGNPFRWHGVVETRESFQTPPVDSWNALVDPQGRAITYPKPEETPITEAAKHSRLGQVYLDWADYPITETEKLEPEGGWLVRFYDLRFVYAEPPALFRIGRGGSLRNRRPLAAAVQLDPDLKVAVQRIGNRTQQHLD